MPEKDEPGGATLLKNRIIPLPPEVYPQGVLPKGVIRADNIDSGIFSASFSADRLFVPAKLIGSEQLTDAVLADLRSRTLAFYDKQHARMESQHIPKGKRRNIQEIFDEQVEVFCDVTGGVENAFRENPALDMIMLGWDADNTQGVVDEDAPSAIVLPEDLKNKSSSEFTPKERRLMEKIYVKDMYDRWIWNPAFLVAAKYLDDKYRDDDKHKVIQALLTTKDQEGLDENYADMLDDELPGIFDPRLIMSSNFNTRSSAAEKLFPEITPALGERDKRGRPEKSLTVQQTLELIHASRQERTILMERILDKEGSLTEFDMKFLMMGRILDRSIREGMGGINPEPPQGVAPEEWHDKLFRERMFILVEDNAHPPVLPHTQIGYIKIPRFRTPDSPDDVS